jgi:hypothetical protein
MPGAGNPLLFCGCAQILLNGVDLRTIDMMWLRRNLSLVSQEPELFADTLLCVGPHYDCHPFFLLL